MTSSTRALEALPPGEVHAADGQPRHGARWRRPAPPRLPEHVQALVQVHHPRGAAGVDQEGGGQLPQGRRLLFVRRHLDRRGPGRALDRARGQALPRRGRHARPLLAPDRHRAG
eukprot:2550421-Prymnesium_polylepis.1